MMKSFSRNKLKILLLLALCLVFSGAVISCGSIIKLNANQKNVNNSNEIILRLDKTISEFTNAHTARYKYLKSTNTDYLKFYISAREKIDANIQSLKKLTKDNYQQQQKVFLLEKTIFNQLNIFEEGFYIKQKNKLNLSNKLVSKKPIERLIDSIEKNEKSLLLNQIEISQLSLKKATIAFLIAGLINLGLVLQFYYLLKNYITKLKKTESALRQSENRLRAIIDAEPASIKLIHTNSNILEINASGIEMMEVENADALVGKSIYTAVPPEYQTAYKLMHESVCSGNKETLEFEIVGFKGTRRWMETYAIPLPNENDSGFLHLAITQDITQRKASEQKLQEQAALLDVVTNAILVKDIQNKILYWNKGAENIYGWSASEVYGKKSSRLLHREYSSQQDDALLSVINVGQWEGELHQITKEGKDIIIQSRWTLLRDEKERPKYILAENTEVTQKKKLETQLLRTQRLESIGTLAGGIAHDLNNVLTPILMSVQLLERKLQDSQYIQLLKTLENNAQRGAGLIKQLLSFARGIEGKKSLIQTKYLIAEIEQVIRETFPKSIKLNINIPTNLSCVCGDATQLHQVLMNLVVNARDAMPNGGELDISAENLLIDECYVQMNAYAKTGAYIVVTVTDTGVGIHPEIQERIFEPFFTTKELGKGTGLGLSTALGIVKNHGGFVNVYSKLNKGTIVKIYLPIQQTEETNIDDCDELEDLNGSGELILVVDDEPAIRKITKSSLEAYNYRVLTASNGLEALDIYARYQQEINLVLLDMMMPEMDGETTIATLQKINREVKIIAISGLVLNYNTVSPQSLCVKAFMSKPCTGKELLHTIAKVSRDFR
ncbi:multi-sensor signal transduction histidine kinase [Calothrix parasitica NIES-267]|uniref:histidine kinase n=1 Tax=Calothrix parasitica NIES-267 TaxID=1973488 RepID=A0A1Z4LQJ7_9CYAN|nr:multi-sensor signal transduction histidine kinase [Calothrix parasitica NIES-267]